MKLSVALPGVTIVNATFLFRAFGKQFFITIHKTVFQSFIRKKVSVEGSQKRISGNLCLPSRGQ